MAADFSAGAVRLAGMAGALLGWRPGEFWNATPAELATVLLALAPSDGAALDADDLARMMKEHPDG